MSKKTKWCNIGVLKLSRNVIEQKNLLHFLHKRNRETILIKVKMKVIARGYLDVIIYHDNDEYSKQADLPPYKVLSRDPDGTVDWYFGIKITSIRRPNILNKYYPGVKTGDIMIKFRDFSVDIGRL